MHVSADDALRRKHALFIMTAIMPGHYDSIVLSTIETNFEIICNNPSCSSIIVSYKQGDESYSHVMQGMNSGNSLTAGATE